MPESLPRVLFVCVENSCRSQMAEGFARALGAGRVSAFSAGSRPSGEIHPMAVRFMRERGIDLSAQTSKGLDDLPAGVRWEYIVTMGCGDACPVYPGKRYVDWDVEDPSGKQIEGVRPIRDELERRVLGLIDEIGVRSS